MTSQEINATPPSTTQTDGHDASSLLRPLGTKVQGRVFYESIGSPRYVLAPMVDQSEFAWRILSRSFMPAAHLSKPPLLAYTPMLHSRLFNEGSKFRDAHFLPLRSSLADPHPLTSPHPYDSAPPYLDGNPSIDRPLIVQFCANTASDLLAAAQYVQPFCDAVDLNLGCPQGIARKGHYGAFLQEDVGLIVEMIRKLHERLEVPVTAKIRILETKEQTLQYAKRIVEAGVSILTVHGRRREMKGHKTGLADWSVIRFLKENLPEDVVIFANGNVLQHEDLDECLKQTGADGVMSAEGNLCDPGIFAAPPEVGQEGRQYWRDRDGQGGWRMDEVFRRYMDIIYKYVLEQPPPVRKSLFLPSDSPTSSTSTSPPPPSSVIGTSPIDARAFEQAVKGKRKHSIEPQQSNKKQKTNEKNSKRERPSNPSLLAMQAHLFHLLRPLVARHTNIRDALAKSRAGDISAFENVLQMVEEVVAEGIRKYAETDGKSWAGEEEKLEEKLLMSLEKDEEADNRMGVGEACHEGGGEDVEDPCESSINTVRRCRRPWWVVQPYVRPLPKEALKKGSWKLSKKEEREKRVEKVRAHTDRKRVEEGTQKKAKQVEQLIKNGLANNATEQDHVSSGFVEKEKIGQEEVDIPREGLVCG